VPPSPPAPVNNHDQQQPGGLLKVLGVGFGIAVLVGNTIGMGILRTPGEVARHLPSTAWFLAVWVVGALYALLGALTVAEMGAMRPRSGGMYPLVRDGLGPFPGFVAGWTDWFIIAGSAAAVSMVLAEYAAPLLPGVAGKERWLAVAVIAGLVLLQWRGIRLGDVVQQATSLIKTVALLGLAAVALYLAPAVEPGAVAPAAVALPAGGALAAAIVVALQSAIYTYDGWNGPVYFGGEVRDPGRDIPRAMIGGVLLVLAIYLAMNIAFLRIVPIAEMAGDPFVAATAARRLFGATGDTVLRVVMVLSMVAAVNAIILIYSRVPFAMATDGMLPSPLRRVNAGGTPVASLVAGTALAMGFVITNTFDTVLALLAFFMVFNYALVFLAFFRLRLREPQTPRPFRVPWYPVVPGLALAGPVAFLVAAVVGDRTNSLIAVGLIALSWPLSVLIRRRMDGPPAVPLVPGPEVVE
jgi:basic amino acid/polyamine antiporter, APA family